MLMGGSDGIMGKGEAEEAELAAVKGCLSKQWREARRFEANAGLRRERARVTEQLKRFQLHLHQRAQAAQQQAKEQQVSQQQPKRAKRQ